MRRGAFIFCVVLLAFMQGCFWPLTVAAKAGGQFIEAANTLNGDNFASGVSRTGRTYLAYNDQEVKKGEPALFSGSGFFIAPDVVVTSNHVVRGASRIEVLYNNTVQLTGVVIASDEVSDLALLRVSGLEAVIHPLVLADPASMQEGSRVYTVGYPLPLIMGVQPKISEGIINCAVGINGDLKMVQISVPVQPGNSGGPLLNDRAEVVGVVAGGLNAAYLLPQGILPQNVNYAVKINNIYNLLSNSRLNMSLAEAPHHKRKSAAEVMDVAKKAVVLVMVLK